MYHSDWLCFEAHIFFPLTPLTRCEIMLEKPTNQVSTLETHKSFSAPTLKFYPNIRIIQIMHVNRNANWKAEKLNGQLLLSPSSASLAFDDGGSLMCPFHLLIVLWLIKFSVEHSLELLPSGIAWTLGFFTHCCSQKAFKVKVKDTLMRTFSYELLLGERCIL